MSRPPRYSRLRFPLVLFTAVTLLSVGCGRPPTDPTEPDGLPAEPLLAKKPPASGYTMVLLEPVAGAVVGQAMATASDINDRHQVVGAVSFGNPERDGCAFFWSASAGGLQPECLPDLPGATASMAADINESGDIVGASGSGVFWNPGYSTVGDPTPVIWQPGGTGWTVRELEAPGVARGLNELGEAVGYRPVDPDQWNDEPVYWDAAGAATVLPMPPGYVTAIANRINAQGDIAGAARTPGGVVWAVLWVRVGPATWIPTVLNGGDVLGLTDRRSDGTLQATGHALSPRSECCQAVRWTIAIDPDTGAVEASREYVGTDMFKYGAGHAINAAGDVGGSGIQGNNFAGTPQAALYPATGTTVKMPLARNATGTANAISGDRWLAGQMDGAAVVWRP